MRKITFILAVFILSSITFSDFSFYKVPTHIELYPDMAKVGKKGSFTVKEDTSRIIFQDIPVSADLNSFTFSLKGIDILNISFEKKMTDNTSFSEELRQLEEKRKSIETELNIQEKIDNIINKALFSENMRFQPGKDFIGLIDEVEKRIYSISEKKERLKEELNTIRKEIDIINSRRNSVKIRYFYNAEIDIEKIDSGKKVDYEISYIVKNCSWNPEYTINVDSEKKTVDFRYKAEISQNTGEDWENASITLSTSKPASINSVPQINPWYVSVYEPVIYRKQKMSRSNAPQAMYDSLAEISSEKELVYEEEKKVVEDMLGYSFNLGRITLKDGERGKKVNIESREIEVDLKFLVVPYLMKESMLTGVFRNKTGMPFLQGQALIFLDSDYRGKQNIGFTSIDDTLEVSFGNYPELFCVREKVKDKKSRIGLLSKSNVHEISYRTIIKNTSSRELELKIKDRIPVSQDSRINIRVDYSRDDLVQNKDNSERGLLEYNVKIGSGREKELRQDIRVEYPEEMSISGL